MPPQASQSSPSSAPTLPPGYYDVDAQSAKPPLPEGYYDADAAPKDEAAAPKAPKDEGGYHPEKVSGISAGPTQPSIQNEFQSTGGNPFERYMTEAENMTQEGAKAHPVENFIGQTATRAKQFGGILASEAGFLFGGPGELAGEAAPLNLVVPKEAPPIRAPRQLPEQSSGITTPPPRMSMREQVGARPVNEPAPPIRTLTVQPTKAETTPMAPVPKTEPAPPPLSNRQIGSRLTQGIQEAAGTKADTPIFRRPQGTVGAKTVSEEPNVDIAGPRIQTPSRNETLTENLKNRVPGSNPVERKIPLLDQPASPARTAAQPAEETVHPMDRQFIHVNGGRALEAIKDKPDLRDPLLDLEGNQLLEVLRKSGEDMSKIQSVGKSAGKAARGGTISDPTNISRQEAFDMLFDKGYTPEQILKEAGERSKPAGKRVAFGPPR